MEDLIRKVMEKLREWEEKSEYKVIVHPSVVSYDYRIARTWEEMDKRNKWNNKVDDIRLTFRLPARPYGKPLYSEWKTHWGKDKPLEFSEWW